MKLLCAALIISLISKSSFAEDAFGGGSSEIARVEDVAEPGDGDGVYGRLNGDFSVRALAGVEIDGVTPSVRALAAGHLMMYQTAGLHLTYRNRLQEDDPIENVLSAGVVLSPLFLYRWSKAMESGSPYLDLMVDSLALAAGVHMTTPRQGAFGSTVGFEGGLLFGIPILPRADGLWIRSRLNFSTGRSTIADQSAVATSVFVALAWEGFFFAGVLPD